MSWLELMVALDEREEEARKAEEAAARVIDMAIAFHGSKLLAGHVRRYQQYGKQLRSWTPMGAKPTQSLEEQRRGWLQTMLTDPFMQRFLDHTRAAWQQREQAEATPKAPPPTAAEIRAAAGETLRAGRLRGR